MIEANSKDIIDDEHEKAVNIEIKMTKKALFNYMLINSFAGAGGKLVWGVSLLALIYLPFSLTSDNNMLITLLLVIIVVNAIAKPLRFKLNAKQQLNSNETFKHSIKYSISKKGVHVSQFLGEGLMEWNNFIKVVEKRKLILLYITETQAFILIKNQIIKKEDINRIREVVKSVDSIKYKFL